MCDILPNPASFGPPPPPLLSTTAPQSPSSPNHAMTNEWIDWTETRLRQPLRGSLAVSATAAAAAACNHNYLLNNNYASKFSASLGLKMHHSVMKSLHRNKGIARGIFLIQTELFIFCLDLIYSMVYSYIVSFIVRAEINLYNSNICN